MYVAGAAHPNRALALGLLSRVKAGRIEACISTDVLQEVLYRYTSLGNRGPLDTRGTVSRARGAGPAAPRGARARRRTKRSQHIVYYQ